jgi:hypothetical protein
VPSDGGVNLGGRGGHFSVAPGNRVKPLNAATVLAIASAMPDHPRDGDDLIDGFHRDSEESEITAAKSPAQTRHHARHASDRI